MYTLWLGTVAQSGPSFRPSDQCGTCSEDSSPYVTGFTLSASYEAGRRPCGGCPSTVCSAEKPLRRLLTVHQPGMDKTVNNSLRFNTGGERRLIPRPGFMWGLTFPGRINPPFLLVFVKNVRNIPVRKVKKPSKSPRVVHILVTTVRMLRKVCSEVFLRVMPG